MGSSIDCLLNAIPNIFPRLFPDINWTFQFQFVCPTNFPLGEFLLTIKSESREQIEHPLTMDAANWNANMQISFLFRRIFIIFFTRELLTYAMCINFRFALKHFRKIIINVGEHNIYIYRLKKKNYKKQDKAARVTVADFKIIIQPQGNQSKSGLWSRISGPTSLSRWRGWWFSSLDPRG